jgi:hypothetical protein
MNTSSAKQLLVLQALTLFGGTVFAWSKLLPQFMDFQERYGTLFRFNDLTIPNPFLTACLYGSTAFLVVLFWSVRVYQNPSERSERYLRNFLLFCVAFAASVVASEAIAYYEIFAAPISVTCSPGVPPTETPCFYGMLFFIAAFSISIFATRRLK